MQKARESEMSKQAMREETERLVKEAMEHKAIAIIRGKTRIESKCAKVRRKATNILRRLRPFTIPLSIAVREAAGIELRC